MIEYVIYGSSDRYLMVVSDPDGDPAPDFELELESPHLVRIVGLSDGTLFHMFRNHVKGNWVLEPWIVGPHSTCVRDQVKNDRTHVLRLTVPEPLCWVLTGNGEVSVKP